MQLPSVLIPIAPGTNRDGELALAFQAAGAQTTQVPLQALRNGEVKLVDYQILGLPGGFSYGDALGAGRLLGLDLDDWFATELAEARSREMPIIGICNGFQALVRAGLLPGPTADGGSRPAATLAANANGRFECRWVELVPAATWSPWMEGVEGPIRCPIAHGEGRFLADDLPALQGADRVAFRYGSGRGVAAEGAYPANPNGSPDDVAGIVDETGLVLGMMPHPEDHVLARQDPARHRRPGGSCLSLFRSGVRAVLRG